MESLRDTLAGFGLVAVLVELLGSWGIAIAIAIVLAGVLLSEGNVR